MRHPFTRVNRGVYGHWLRICSGRARGDTAAAIANATTKTAATAGTALTHAPTHAVLRPGCTAIKRKGPVADSRVFSSSTPSLRSGVSREPRLHCQNTDLSDFRLRAACAPGDTWYGDCV